MNRGFMNQNMDQKMRGEQGDNWKPKAKKSEILLRLSKYVLMHKAHALFALVLMLGSNFFALLGPYLSGRAVSALDSGKGNVDFPKVFMFCALLALFYIASAGLSYTLSITMIKLSQKIIRELRRQVFTRLSSLPVGFFDKLQAGDIISRISYDIDTINASLSNDLLQIITTIIIVTGSFISMLLISPIMLTVFIITIPISVFLSVYRAKKIRPLFRKRSGTLGVLNGFAEEALSGIKTIKTYNKEDIFTNRYQAKNIRAAESYYNAEYQAVTIGPSVNFINNLSLSLISVVGSILYLNGGIALGSITSFILYSRKFSGPINELANIFSDIQSSCAAAERVFYLIDENPEKEDDEDAVSLDEVKGEIKFENVKFGYVEGIEIIHNLNLNVESGKTVAIVGPTGAGKTTIINLLMRFYDPQGGKIYLDGIDISKIKRKDLRRAWSMVLQDTWLFNGTIEENIAYGKTNATHEEVEYAAKAAGIHDFIMSQPKRYDTYLEDGGLNISKGQKQLLTIARAMLSDAKMLILDEATSNVDTRTEIQIEEAMLKLMKNKTCFVIAHRLSTIKNADMILVVRDGDIVEKGTHRELLNKNGFYAELYRSQYE